MFSEGDFTLWTSHKTHSFLNFFELLLTAFISQEMSFGIKKTINTSLRGIGVKTFDAAAVNALAEYIEKDGSDGALKDFMRVWKSGLKIQRVTELHGTCMVP